MTKWQMAKLRRVVFEYNVPEAVWEEKFALLKEFELWEGHTRVACDFDTDKYPNEQRFAKGEKLRARHRIHRIGKEHIARLEELGFWSGKLVGNRFPK